MQSLQFNESLMRRSEIIQDPVHSRQIETEKENEKVLNKRCLMRIKKIPH